VGEFKVVYPSLATAIGPRARCVAYAVQRSSPPSRYLVYAWPRPKAIITTSRRCNYFDSCRLLTTKNVRAGYDWLHETKSDVRQISLSTR